MRCVALTLKNKRCKNSCLHGKYTCFNHTQFDQYECVICNNEVSSQTDSFTLECHHRFCKNCIKSWFEQQKDTCPMCRSRVSLQIIRQLVPNFTLQSPRIQIPISHGGIFTIDRRLNNRTFVNDLIVSLQQHVETLPDE